MKLNWKNINLIFLVFFQLSCGIIAINPTLYGNLPDNEKAKLCQSFSNTCQIVEIKADDLKEELKKYPYNIVIIWTPSCNYNLSFIKKLKDTSDTNFKIWLVSTDFFIKRILLAKEIYDLDMPMLVIHHQYGLNINIAEKRFIEDLCGFENRSSVIFRDTIDTFLFKKDSLLRFGSRNLLNQQTLKKQFR